ncbi:MAG TPA: hypothetical protein VMY37_16245 [Thermoguttaceae bacterium]|nr:hypothetical protein [Thermoguttaceae bacterium]
MATYRFTVILAGLREISDELADALFEAGCDDGSPWSSQGVAAVGFDREAESFEQAVRSAVADVQKAGCHVAWVKIEPEDLVESTAAGDAPAAKK